MMNEKRASKQVTLEDWSQPIQSASDQHSLEISRTFKLSVATPHISIEALGGHYHGIIKHTIEKLNPDSPPPSPTNSFSSWSTTSSHEGCHSPNNRPKINVQVTITYREGDLNSAKEISVVHQKKDNKVCDRIVVSRKSTLSNTFSWKKPPFVEILVIYPFNTCLGNESVATKSVNLPVVVEDLSKIFFTQFIVESTNGYVDVQSATANSLLMISSTNGPITSSGVLRAPKVKLTTVNAPIQVSNLISPENVSLQSTNGPINVTSSLRSNVLTIENINGSISLNSVVASSAMKVSSHNQIEIKSAKSNSVILNTYQGKIQGSFNVNKEIKLTTKTGSIDAKIQISKPFNGNQVQSEINSGTGNIQVRYQPHPEEIRLISAIKSEIGSIDLIHSQGYTGKFKVESKLGRVEIENEEKIEDKLIEQSKAGGRKVEGEIRMGESKTMGRSEVSTNLGSVEASFSN